ncbi:hypothetical protein, conserved [Leishmania tarentolae]|uniref:Uncharacterized protein n=1 Tax=Leishmania tarentolae TaxID=5689 RepID=A0A640KI37_LEITA|nr:hypothetical protein, conserved [Leishmania tarentolae]
MTRLVVPVSDPLQSPVWPYDCFTCVLHCVWVYVSPRPSLTSPCVHVPGSRTAMSSSHRAQSAAWRTTRAYACVCGQSPGQRTRRRRAGRHTREECTGARATLLTVHHHLLFPSALSLSLSRTLCICHTSFFLSYPITHAYRHACTGGRSPYRAPASELSHCRHSKCPSLPSSSCVEARRPWCVAHALLRPTSTSPRPPTSACVTSLIAMSWEPGINHRSQYSHTVDRWMPSSAAAVAHSSYSRTLAATQPLQPQLEHLQKNRTEVGSGPSISTAMAAVAQQKARYARCPYVPPPALRRSRIQLGPTVDTSGVLGETQHMDDGHHALTQPAKWALSLKPASAQRRSSADAGFRAPATAPRTTPSNPLSLPPPTEWCQAFVALQERQLLCWQQLIETQQLMTHHVGQIQEELRCVQEVLKHGFDKRSRWEGPDHCEAATMTKSAAGVPTVSAPISQRNISVNVVRLLGESATSTPAVVQDAVACRSVARPAESPQRCTGKSPAERKGGSRSGAAHPQSTTDAADSEADIFML